MLLFDVRRALIARWYLVLVGVLLTVGAGGAAARLVPVTYESEAYVLLLPPRSAVPEGGNPFLVLGGLSATADVVARAVGDDTTARRLKSVGITGEYAVGPDATTSGPVIAVTATGSSQSETLRTMQVVMAQIPVTLVRLQSSTQLRQSSFVTSEVISSDETAEPQRKTQIRAVIAAVGLGLAATVVGTALIDASLLRRQRRRPETPRSQRRSRSTDVSAGSAGETHRYPDAPARSGTASSNASAESSTRPGNNAEVSRSEVGAGSR